MSAPVTLTLAHNPLEPERAAEYELAPGSTLIQWLSTHYPQGFGRPVSFTLNGEPLDVADADRVLEPGDRVHVLVAPGAPAIGPTIVAALVQAAIAAVAAVAFAVIMGKPRNPRAHDAPAPDPVYSVTAAQNAARVLEPVPVLYGRMVTVPDYAAQPYVWFEGNEQYLALLLVIGQGEYVLHDVQVGETPVSALESDAVTYWLLGPDDHLETMGEVEAVTGLMENVVTSPEVADQELSGVASGGDTIEFTDAAEFFAPSTIVLSLGGTDPEGMDGLQVSGTTRNNGNYTIDTIDGAFQTITVNEATVRNEETTGAATFRYFGALDDTAVGPFVTCKPGVAGDRLMLDFVLPQGLYEVDNETGDLLPITLELTIEYQELDDDGDPVGGWTAHPLELTNNTNTAIRVTETIDVDPGRYRVRVWRSSPPASSANEISAVTWTGLKFRLLPTVGAVYGPVSLLAVKIRATNGIASSASSRVRAEVTRKLAPLGVGALAPTTSPADAFVDVMTNPVYGARRPLEELDLAELERLVDHWAGRAHFNGGFAQKSTIWEALTLVLQTAGAAPLPLGQLMSLTQDGVRATRAQLFSDANIVRGSLAVGYGFDKPGDNDGVEVEYRDPQAFNPRYVTYPPGALDADRVTLFGCTDATTAGEFARLLWNKRTRLRKTATFDTELEGLLARLGDRVAVATALPRWGKAGVVVAVDGLELVLDDPPDWNGTGHFVLLRDEYGAPSEPIAVAPGASAAAVVLAELPPFALYGTGAQEPTHYAFGNAVELVRDFTVTAMQPSGASQVSLEAIVYDPEAYDGAPPWMQEPV